MGMQRDNHLILFLTILIDYLAGIAIESAQGKRRKAYLVVSIISNLLLLAVFKYYNFFIVNYNAVSGFIGRGGSFSLLSIVLPIGLSFHTFQAMSYTVEVYKGEHKAERHLGIYALYVMFFPQLVAGPIERPQNLIHQFYEKHDFCYEEAANGLRQIMWGLFKKVVIADRISTIVDPVFNAPEKFSAVALTIACLLFSFQLYCDFSGYSDIANGSARVLGFKLMRNFRHPNAATTVADYRRRWHISLNIWLKEYLYIPICGKNVSAQRRTFAFFLVFIASGFWHGANWTFIVWGLINAIFYFYAKYTRDIRKSLASATGLSKINWLHSSMQKISVFLLITFSRIFFRASSVSSALSIIKKMFIGLIPETIKAISNFKIVTRELLIGVDLNVLFASILLIVFLEWVHAYEGEGDIYEIIGRKSKALRWGVYFAGFLSITYFGVFDHRSFIYFQF